jgi:hypothetical protein
MRQGTSIERFVDHFDRLALAGDCHDAALEGLHQWLDRFLELHEARQFEWEENPISLIQVRCIVFVDFAGTGIIYGPEFGQSSPKTCAIYGRSKTILLILFICLVKRTFDFLLEKEADHRTQVRAYHLIPAPSGHGQISRGTI